MGFSEDSASLLERPPQRARAQEVVVYTSNGCPKCTMLKKWLKNRNTGFAEKDLEDVDVMANLVMRNVVVLSAPALEVEGTVYTVDQIFEGERQIDPRLLEVLKGF